eukprot:6094183-Prymnesium_polylepis.1
MPRATRARRRRVGVEGRRRARGHVDAEAAGGDRVRAPAVNSTRPRDSRREQTLARLHTPPSPPSAHPPSRAPLPCATSPGGVGGDACDRCADVGDDGA